MYSYRNLRMNMLSGIWHLLLFWHISIFISLPRISWILKLSLYLNSLFYFIFDFIAKLLLLVILFNIDNYYININAVYEIFFEKYDSNHF